MALYCNIRLLLAKQNKPFAGVTITTTVLSHSDLVKDCLQCLSIVLEISLFSMRLLLAYYCHSCKWPIINFSAFGQSDLKASLLSANQEFKKSYLTILIFSFHDCFSGLPLCNHCRPTYNQTK